MSSIQVVTLDGRRYKLSADGFTYLSTDKGFPNLSLSEMSTLNPRVTYEPVPNLDDLRSENPYKDYKIFQNGENGQNGGKKSKKSKSQKSKKTQRASAVCY